MRRDIREVRCQKSQGEESGMLQLASYVKQVHRTDGADYFGRLFCKNRFADD